MSLAEKFIQEAELIAKMGSSYVEVIDEDKIKLPLSKEDLLIILNQPETFGSSRHEVYDFEKDGSEFVLRCRKKDPLVF